jgi:predicted metalloprotease with PDZ domain
MFTLPSTKSIAAVLLLAAAASAAAQERSTPNMTLVVDETQAARRIAFVHEEIRVQAGPLALAYPKWIPGEHGPTGPIEQMATLRIHAGNSVLQWARDPDDIYTIHVDVPGNTDRITVDFDTLLENTISAHQLLLAWNTTVLYPLNIDKVKLMVQPSIVLPRNWKQGSSLHVTSESEGRLNFAPLSLERLIDSSVLAGEFFRSVPLKSEWPAQLEITGDNQSAVDKADDAHAFDLFGKLVDEDRAMFGFRHWQTLHILVSQSDAVPFDGLEHEDSPWNAVRDAGLSKKDVLQSVGWPLLAHEQSHSWDGKYRRPGELYSKPNYQGPERTSLLWVYEGLNEYIGALLATRAGFNDPAYMRDYWAMSAAFYAVEPARAATPLVDTATEDWVLRSVKGGWMALRRSQDYYDEGALIWMRADTIIREKTQNQRSLDDFLRSFLGQRDTGTIVVPYTREDVEAALSAICPYDWHGFFETRIYQVNGKAPTEGLEAAGWRLVYNETPSPLTFWEETPDAPTYFAWHSIGIDLKKDGTIFDLVPDSPAYQAGLGPQMKILAVNGRAYSSDAVNEAIAHPHDGVISMVVDNFSTVETHEIHYAGGLRYPHLERIPGTHDYLSEILKARSERAQQTKR